MIKQWAEEFRSLGKQEMDTETTKIFLGLMTDKSTYDEKPPGLETHFGFQVTFNRAISIFSKVDWQAAAFIAILTDRPGSAIMYLYAIREKYKELTMESIAFSFPNGFLSDENLSLMWEEQKIDGCNYLDTLTEDNFIRRYVMSRFKFADAQVGDKVYSLIQGEGVVTDVQKLVLEVTGKNCERGYYFYDGRYLKDQGEPVLFYLNDKGKKVIERPVLTM